MCADEFFDGSSSKSSVERSAIGSLVASQGQ